MKALVGAFNQEKTLVWAFPVIIKLRISSNDHHLGMAPGQVSISPVRLILGHQLGGSEAERNDSFEYLLLLSGVGLLANTAAGKIMNYGVILAHSTTWVLPN